MKKALYILGALLGTSTAAQAQTSAIKVNPISLIVSTGNFSFEHATGDKSSFQIGAYYTGFSIGDTKFRGFGLTPEYRFYVSGEALQGFFVGPYVRYTNLNLSVPSFNSSGSPTTDEATLSTFGGGVNLGYQWVFGEHFSLEPFFRLGYNGGSVKVKSGNSESFDTGSFTGANYTPGLNIGYAF